MKFKIGQFWWSKNKKDLVLILNISEDGYLFTKTMKNPKRIVLYNTDGRKFLHPLGENDLVEQETDARVIAKYTWGERHATKNTNSD